MIFRSNKNLQVLGGYHFFENDSIIIPNFFGNNPNIKEKKMM